MILVDKPYVSDFLIQTLQAEKFPVLQSPLLQAEKNGLNAKTTAELVASYHTGEDPLVYTNSENILQWVNENLPDTPLPGFIQQFKNKFRFRELLKPLFPNYHYEKHNLDELLNAPAESLPYPFILKPVIGFFSYGIHIVKSQDEWAQTRINLQEELKRVQDIYPREVLNDSEFLLEDLIDGPEYAVDAYFDQDGEPVIVNIYKHLFASEKDVSDRAYFSSPEVMDEMLTPVTQFLRQVSARSGARRFPIHIELRHSPQHGIIPIEANALRFAGWCMTDVTHHAWGINPYTVYFYQQKPDWERLMNERAGRQYNMYIADLPHDIDFRKIASVDYEAIRQHFARLLELRPTDYHNYPVLAFIFTESKAGDFRENRKMLQEDFRKYLRF